MTSELHALFALFSGQGKTFSCSLVHFVFLDILNKFVRFSSEQQIPNCRSLQHPLVSQLLEAMQVSRKISFETFSCERIKVRCCE